MLDPITFRRLRMVKNPQVLMKDCHAHLFYVHVADENFVDIIQFMSTNVALEGYTK